MSQADIYAMLRRQAEQRTYGSGGTLIAGIRPSSRGVRHCARGAEVMEPSGVRRCSKFVAGPRSTSGGVLIGGYSGMTANLIMALEALPANASRSPEMLGELMIRLRAEHGDHTKKPRSVAQEAATARLILRRAKREDLLAAPKARARAPKGSVRHCIEKNPKTDRCVKYMKGPRMSSAPIAPSLMIEEVGLLKAVPGVRSKALAKRLPRTALARLRHAETKESAGPNEESRAEILEMARGEFATAHKARMLAKASDELLAELVAEGEPAAAQQAQVAADQAHQVAEVAEQAAEQKMAEGSGRPVRGVRHCKRGQTKLMPSGVRRCAAFVKGPRRGKAAGGILLGGCCMCGHPQYVGLEHPAPRIELIENAD